jgi:glycosyltransferase involved in cell wall biosynthesis
MISIILPTYNGGNRIKTAIQSVLNQSYMDWELLVIDDGSTDNIAQIMADFTSEHPNIRYLKNDQNIGIQKTLNKGLKEADGEYIARIDDDDEWIDKDKLQKQIDFLLKNKDHVLVGTGLVAVDEAGREIFKKLNIVDDSSIRNNILSKNCFTHSSVLFIKDNALQFGGYDEDITTRHIEDYDLWLNLGTIGKFANLPIYSVKFTIRADSLSSKNKIIQFERSIKLIKNFKDQYPNYFESLTKLSIRMVVFKMLNFGFMKNIYKFLYKYYKNI